MITHALNLIRKRDLIRSHPVSDSRVIAILLMSAGSMAGLELHNITSEVPAKHHGEGEEGDVRDIKSTAHHFYKTKIIF